MNKTQAARKADTLFSLHIREAGRCWLANDRCNGHLQCAHIISRRYRAIRWEDDNAVPLCAAHHVYYTHHPLEWQEVILRMGVDYESLRLRALDDPPMDPFDVIKRLEAA